MNGDDEAFLTEGLYEEPSPIQERRRDGFSGWHKPRKQYIREFQWNRETAGLLDRIVIRDGRPLKYLGLPGDDLLDIRHLNSLCTARGIGLKYLGFNYPNPSRTNEQAISENEVMHFPNIHESSQIVLDHFQLIGDKRSRAYTILSEYGPFDIINLDLCNSVAQGRHERHTGNHRYFDAIYQILNFQMRNRTDPWILFLTTRSDEATVDHADLERLWNCVSSNMNHHEDFRIRLETFMECNLAECHTIDDLNAELDQSKFMLFFGVGIGKWLLDTMMGGNPQCSVQMLDGYYYRVDRSRRPNMISAAFLFSPLITPRPNVAGLATHVEEEENPDIDLAQLRCNIVDVVEALVDLDNLMDGDAAIQHQMIEETKNLLRQARYSVDNYEEWLQGDN